MGTLKLLDPVALLKDRPELRLVIGQVGIIAEPLDNNTFVVQFCNPKGNTLALAMVKAEDLLLLHYDQVAV